MVAGLEQAESRDPRSTNPSPTGSASPTRVLVPEAHAIGMVGVVRSLGRAGHEVHAVAAQGEAIGFHSRFAAHHAVCPAYDDPGFCNWLRAYIEDHRIPVVVPSESLLRAVRHRFEEFAPLMPISRDPGIVYGTIGKFSVFERLLETDSTSQHLPPVLLIGPDDDVPDEAAIEPLGLPVFIKADGIRSLSGGDDEIHRADSAVEAVRLITSLRQRYSHLLVQGFVPGRGAGVCLLQWDGDILLECMNTCEHEVPHTGGFCSLRTSWRHEEMLADARTKLEHLGWQGVAMLEYRWDEATGRFFLVEINARFWAALHLALFSGADFPAVLIESHLGRPARAPTACRVGIRSRLTAPFEISYLLSRWRDRGLPLRARLWSGIEFVGLFFNPFLRSDLLFPGDRGLYWVQWGRVLSGLYRGARRAGRGDAPPEHGIRSDERES